MALLKQKLLHGIGFEVLRGLPVATYSHAFAAAIFYGIGAHLGSARSQNADGHVLGHVRDIGADVSDPSSRIYQTSKRQTFHTDSADVVGLLCIRDARKGGKSLLVSVLSIYNEMLSRRPDLLIRLFDPIATDRRGEVPEGRKPYMEIPPLNWHDGYLTVFYQRQYIDSAQRFDDAMRLSARHVEALDLFDSLADDPELHLAMQLRPGDGICFASGCLLKATVRCPSVSRSDMARWKSAIAVESSPENHVMNFTHRFVEPAKSFLSGSRGLAGRKRRIRCRRRSR